MAAAVMKYMASNFSKLDKFEGEYFRRWQKKMHFLLSSMSVVYMLTTLILDDGGNNPTVEQVRKRARKNLVSSSVLNNCGYKQVIESNKFVLSKHAFMSTSKLNDSILWHVRLGHVHFKRMQDMSKDGLIPASDMDTEKCMTSMLNKITKKLFQNVKRETKVLELIHSDLCDLHATPSPWNKKNYPVTFIDDASRFYVTKPNESVLIHSIIESNDVIFDENRFSSVSRPSLRIPNRTKDIGGSVVLKEVTKETEAINDEIESIMGNNTWVLANLPLGCKPLGCKWIFKRKLKVYGVIEKFKARLVIQGLKQKSRINYFDTYAPVMRISTIRLLIAMASIHNLIIRQMDVKTTFLNGDLDEEAPKQWHQKFDEVVLSNGYLLNQADKCVYSKFDESGKGVIICLYVDDMLIFGTNQKEAINDEMDSIMDNNTWVLADLPPSFKPLGYKWIFNRKLKMDVQTAFLNGELDKDIYMNQPQGFILLGNENKLCKLIKSLCGLKQAPKQ
nr:zinc finger, CCHC-type [Tanacetum cinerariifolium]